MTKPEIRMTKLESSNQARMKNAQSSKRGADGFDLEERTAKFGEEIIRLARQVASNAVTAPVLSQLVRAGTSVGANYCEATDAESKKGLPAQDRSVPKGIAGDEILAENAGRRRLHGPGERQGALAGSKGTKSHLR